MKSIKEILKDNLADKLSLGLFFVSQILFIILSILGLLLGQSWELILALILIRYLFVMMVMGRGLSRFRESDLTPLLPLLELLLLGSQMALFFSNTNSQPKRWK